MEYSPKIQRLFVTLKQAVAGVGQLWVNSQIPSYDPVTLWLTGKSCCIKSIWKLGNPEESQKTTSDKTPLNKHVGDLQMQEEETAKDFCNKIRLSLQKTGRHFTGR